jgi:hypothetical protein
MWDVAVWKGHLGTLAATAKSSLLTQLKDKIDRPAFTKTVIPPPLGDIADDNDCRWRRVTISLAYLPAKTHGWPLQNTVGEVTFDSHPPCH